MKRLLALSLLLAAAACAVDNRSSIEIDGRAAPSDPTTCKFAPGGQNILGPGLLDVASSMQPSYSLVLYVKNNITNPAIATLPVAGQPATVVAGSKAWTAQIAKVRINPSGYVNPSGPNPPLLSYSGPPENRVPLDGQTIQPGGGQATEYVTAVSGALGAQLATAVSAGDTRQIVLGITLQGQTLDGANVDSGEWYFPLDVCNGCLTCPAGQVMTSTGCVACPTGSLPTASNCFGFGQDTAPICAAPKTQ